MLSRHIKDCVTDTYERPTIKSINRYAYDSLQRMNPSTLVHGLLGRDVDPYAVKLAWETPQRARSQASQDSMDRGTLAHLMILEPHRVEESIAIWDGSRRAGAEWDAFQDANHGRLIIRRSDYEEVKTGALIAAANPRVRDLFSGGTVEPSICWTENKIACKGRVDYLTEPNAMGIVTMPDLKTTEAGIDERSVIRTITSFHNREKMAWYRRGAAATHCIPTDSYRCYNVFVRLSPPYGVNVVQLSSDGLDWAEERMLNILDAVSVCIDSGLWNPVSLETGFGLSPWELAEEKEEWTE